MNNTFTSLLLVGSLTGLVLASANYIALAPVCSGISTSALRGWGRMKGCSAQALFVMIANLTGFDEVALRGNAILSFIMHFGVTILLFRWSAIAHLQ